MRRCTVVVAVAALLATAGIGGAAEEEALEPLGLPDGEPCAFVAIEYQQQALALPLWPTTRAAPAARSFLLSLGLGLGLAPAARAAAIDASLAAILPPVGAHARRVGASASPKGSRAARRARDRGMARSLRRSVPRRVGAERREMRHAPPRR